MIAPRPQTVMRWLIAIIASVTGAYATAVMLVLIVAAASNGGDAETLMLERMAIGVAAIGAASAIGALWLIICGRTCTAAWVGLIPFPVCVVLPAAWLALQD